MIRSRARITFRLSQAHSKNRTQLCSVFLIQLLQPTQNEYKMQTPSLSVEEKLGRQRFVGVGGWGGVVFMAKCYVEMIE